ncbi:hypothetical protein [Nonomuraea salmonea]|uniref:hypothetical protein n=1 Tax=Nonomuraea salmonea TaxID=46181 RepID=UPI0031EBB7E7
MKNRILALAAVFALGACGTAQEPQAATPDAPRQADRLDHGRQRHAGAAEEVRDRVRDRAPGRGPRHPDPAVGRHRRARHRGPGQHRRPPT